MDMCWPNLVTIVTHLGHPAPRCGIASIRHLAAPADATPRLLNCGTGVASHGRVLAQPCNNCYRLRPSPEFSRSSDLGNEKFGARMSSSARTAKGTRAGEGIRAGAPAKASTPRGVSPRQACLLQADRGEQPGRNYVT
jgi:hypothetical protein